MIRLIALLIVSVVAFGAGNSVVLDTMSQELQRNFDALKKADTPSYFMAYQTTGLNTRVGGASQNSATGKKPIAFSGRVQSIDLKMRTVAVRHGSIPGFMPAMTLDYMVDDDAILGELSPSDEITAIVYVGDPVLHNVHVAGHGRDGKNR